MTLVAAAIAAGAAAGVTDTAKQAVNDAYQALKGLITRRYASVDVGVVESRPQLASRRLVLAEELTEAGAGADPELLHAAKLLLDVIEQHAPEAAEAVGVRLHRVRAGELEISDIASTGTGVSIEEAAVEGTLKITGVRAGSPESPNPGQARR